MLAFSWPTGWQQVDCGWSTNWEQKGREVKATSLETNRKLTAGGGTVSAGCVARNGGPNMLPSMFTLNGTVCRTG